MCQGGTRADAGFIIAHSQPQFAADNSCELRRNISWKWSAEAVAVAFEGGRHDRLTAGVPYTFGDDRDDAAHPAVNGFDIGKEAIRFKRDLGHVHNLSGLLRPARCQDR